MWCMSHVVCAEIVASVLSIQVGEGDVIGADTPVIMLESMKMEIPVYSEKPGRVSEILVKPGDIVHDGDPLIVVEG